MRRMLQIRPSDINRSPMASSSEMLIPRKFYYASQISRGGL